MTIEPQGAFAHHLTPEIQANAARNKARMAELSRKFNQEKTDER